LPKEITDIEEFLRLSEKAEVCLIKRSGDVVKLKLRAPRYIYTFKTTPEETESILKKIKCSKEEM